MDNKSHASFRSLLLLALLLCFQSVLLTVKASSSDKVYIVYLREGEKKHEEPEELVTESHLQMLTSVLGSKEEAIISIVYSYGFSGFAAKLSESKAKKIAELPEVVCIRPSRTFKHLTTHSWDFLGVDNSEPSGLLRRANHGEDIIIGVIDSGVWPEAKSFSDEGYGPVPARWKGKCVPGEHFDVHNCNRKLIGARYYKGPGVTTELQKGDYLSARDSGYHGTHVASIAAGNNVSNVNVYQMTGLPVGAARGGAPRARIAVYNVCWAVDVCSESDTIKAVKDAIQDGVDVISISLGSQGYLLDTLKAVKNGIPVILAGGNDGPTPMTITNEAPWAITVAATTIDRSFPTVIALGDGQKLVGQSFYGNRTKNLELVAPNCPRRPLCSCSYETLEGINAKGKVVFCYDPYNSDGLSPTKTLHVAFSTVNDMGAKGLILAQHPFNQIGRLRPEFPCILVDFEIAQRISDYYLHSIRPSVKIKAAKYAIGQEVAPRVAAFSSRGPSARQPELLKPDIAAPGHAIIGAVRNKFVFLSGTSMAAPHVSGVVALLKVIHPDWSPAAIKSALVTTASVTDAYGMPLVAEGTPRKLADPFDFGGGQINPNKAVDPGLVYDMDPYNYGILNCDKVFVESEDTEDCRFKFNEPKHDLNLPSIALPNLKKKLTVTRTITNVAGDARVVYKAVIDSPAGVKMVVQPSTLVFNANAKVKTFNVTFTPIHSIQGIYRFGSLAWDDGVAHYVRIPIAVRTVINYSYADAS